MKNQRENTLKYISFCVKYNISHDDLHSLIKTKLWFETFHKT